MVDALQAHTLSFHPDGVVAEIGAIRLVVRTSRRDQERLLAGVGAGWLPVELELERDGTPLLVGFADETARGFYRALRTVPGIGRVSALGVLEASEPLDVLRAVAGHDERFLTGLPGIGAGRAGQLAKALRKVALPRPLRVPVSTWVIAREALQAEGRTIDDAEALLAAVVQEGMEAEALLQAARNEASDG